MRRRELPLLSIFVVAGILLSNCTLAARSLPDLVASIQAPASGVVVPIAPLDIEGYVLNRSTRDVGRMLFYANGLLIGSADSLLHLSPGHPHSASGSLLWTPPAAGEYFLQVQAERSGTFIVSTAVRICVIEFALDPGIYASAYGYEGLCPIPDRDAAAVPGPITLAVRASPPGLVYDPILPLGSPACSSVADPVISFEATVGDPPEDVAFVVVHYIVTGGPSGVDPGFVFANTVVLTQTGSAPPSSRTFTGNTGSYYLEDALGSVYGSAPGEVTWSAQAIDRGGAVLAEVGPYVIPAVANPLCFALSGSLPAATPATTATPASEADCPPGTFFAPVTSRCIQIQIKTARPGGGGGGCSSYSDISSCTSNGCAWNMNQNSCQ